jgi:hypothetical protein
MDNLIADPEISQLLQPEELQFRIKLSFAINVGKNKKIVVHQKPRAWRRLLLLYLFTYCGHPNSSA